MLYIILPQIFLLFLVLYFVIKKDKKAWKKYRTCKGCGYIYPEHFNFKKATWISSKHNNPETGKYCRWFFHEGHQNND
jgi:hypothetical protein